MTDAPQKRFDRLLKAMVQGEPPKRPSKPSSEVERKDTSKR
jgi:hypothetical protein